MDPVFDFSCRLLRFAHHAPGRCLTQVSLESGWMDA